MRIGIFGYNFRHWKTQEGIQNLVLSGNKPSVVFAADPVELKFYKSKIRIAPKDLFLFHPRSIAQSHSIDYHVVEHNSHEVVERIKNKNLDLGIVLGARILKKEVINSFNIGVLNMHPGILPENRGLDNIKWAIVENMPIGVTCHLINSEIDRGSIISRSNIKIYKDDTLVDIHIRVQNLEQKMMLKSIDILRSGNRDFEPAASGRYFRGMPKEVEENLLCVFEEYKNAFCE
jgi:methionyl-tRNA formyltransferase